LLIFFFKKPNATNTWNLLRLSKQSLVFLAAKGSAGWLDSAVMASVRRHRRPKVATAVVAVARG
jgi:hypothetical protein